MFQRRLTEEMKMLSVSEENIYREQEDFQFTSFQQVSTAPPDAQLEAHMVVMIQGSELVLQVLTCGNGFPPPCSFSQSV